jgi:hypothetical protein
MHDVLEAISDDDAAQLHLDDESLTAHAYTANVRNGAAGPPQASRAAACICCEASARTDSMADARASGGSRPLDGPFYAT